MEGQTRLQIFTSKLKYVDNDNRWLCCCNNIIVLHVLSIHVIIGEYESMTALENSGRRYVRREASYVEIPVVT